MSNVNPYQSPQSRVDEVGQQETGEVRLFSASGRLGRARYIAYSFGIMLVAGLLLAIVGAIGAALSNDVGTIVTIGLGGMVYLFMIVMSFLLAIQRIHDFDSSGWLSLLMLVPIVNAIFSILLWIIPGTNGANRFGAKTPPNGTGVIVLASLVPAVAIIGILAAIAIPVYQGYVEQARQMEHSQQTQQVQPR